MDGIEFEDIELACAVTNRELRRDTARRTANDRPNPWGRPSGGIRAADDVCDCHVAQTDSIREPTGIGDLADCVYIECRTSVPARAGERVDQEVGVFVERKAFDVCDRPSVRINAQGVVWIKCPLLTLTGHVLGVGDESSNREAE